MFLFLVQEVIMVHLQECLYNIVQDLALQGIIVTLLQ